MTRSQGFNDRVAYHEAGHAIVGDHLHHQVERASIEPAKTDRGRSEGRVNLLGDNITAMAWQLSMLPEIDLYRSGIIDATRERAFDLVVIAVAGVTAEKIFVGRNGRLEEQVGDQIEATLYANLIVASRRGRRDMLDAAKIEAERILVERDFEVRALAQALKDRRTLSGKEVNAVIKAARARLRSPSGAGLRRMLTRQRMLERQHDYFD
jgi:ATP-dependent Zn protease